MRYNPCGRIVDMTRRAYSTECRFFRNSDVVTRVRWMEARPDALPLDFPCVILSRQQEPDDWLPVTPGEVAGARRRTTLERAPLGSGTGHVCGTEQDFNEGGLYEPSLDPVRYSTSGLPLCCGPVVFPRGGAGAGGRVGFELARGRFIYGGPASGAKNTLGVWHGMLIVSTLRVTSSVTVTVESGLFVYGGAGAGGSVVFSEAEHDKVYGGAGAGGRVRFNDLVEWVRSTHGDYTFTAEITEAHIIECWGPGAGGQRNPFDSFPPAGGGGGGGAYARSVVGLTAATDYAVRVGIRGDHINSGFPASTEPSKFADTVVRAAGGNTGPSVTGGEGGRLSESIGQILFRGGHGANAPGPISAGGGGGGAGPVGRGEDAIGISGGIATVFTSRGGDGQNSVNPWDGYPVGGGGGGRAAGNSTPHGDGTDGQVRVSWLPPE